MNINLEQEEYEKKGLVKGLDFSDDNPQTVMGLDFSGDTMSNMQDNLGKYKNEKLIMGLEFGEDEGEKLEKRYSIQHGQTNTIKQLDLEKLCLPTNNFNSLQGVIIKDSKEYRNMDVVTIETEVNSLNTKYTIIGGNLYYSESNGELVQISNFEPKAIAIIEEDDGIERVRKYIVKCFLNKSQEYKAICLFGQDLNSDKWVDNKLGVKYMLINDAECRKHFRKYLSEIFAELETKVIYKHVGWRCINNTWCYLHAGGAIGLENENIKGDTDKFIQANYGISQLKSIESGVGLLNLSQDISKTLVQFLYSHLAIMKELFVQANVKPNFALWICGLTGSMKTSTSKVFFNLFNTVTKNGISATFKDTATMLEMKAFEYKDCVLLIDDYHPNINTGEKKEMDNKASEILRIYGDGISKGRATKYLTRQKQFEPRGLCAITGEDFLGGESTVARYIRIDVDKGDFNTDVLLYYQQSPYIIPTYFSYFIGWVAMNFEQLKEIISDSFIKYRKNCLSMFEHQRHAEACAILDVTIDIILKYYCECKYYEELSIYDIEDIWKLTIRNVIGENEIKNKLQSPEIMYLIALQELIKGNKFKLLNKDESNSMKSNLGYKDEEFLYLLEGLVYSEVKKYWQNRGVNYPLSSEQTKKVLDAMNILKIKIESGKKRRTIKISGQKNQRFLAINISRMEEVLNEIN